MGIELWVVQLIFLPSYAMQSLSKEAGKDTVVIEAAATLDYEEQQKQFTAQ